MTREACRRLFDLEAPALRVEVAKLIGLAQPPREWARFSRRDLWTELLYVFACAKETVTTGHNGKGHTSHRITETIVLAEDDESLTTTETHSAGAVSSQMV